MLELIDELTVPPGGWKFRHKESGKTISATGWNQLKGAVREFLDNNSFPIPVDLDEQILMDMNESVQERCQALGVGPMPFVRVVGGPTVIDKARAFAHAMKEWVQAGMTVLSQEDYEKRLLICKRCGYWRGESGLGFVGCGKCGCNRVKLFLSTSVCPLARW